MNTGNIRLFSVVSSVRLKVNGLILFLEKNKHLVVLDKKTERNTGDLTYWETRTQGGITILDTAVFIFGLNGFLVTQNIVKSAGK